MQRARRVKANRRVRVAEEGSAEDRAAFGEQLRVELEASGFPPLLSRTLLDLLSAEKAKWAFCPDCHRKVQVDRPDTGSVHKALELAMGYLVGRPKERQQVEVVGTLGLKPVGEMSDEELERAAAGELSA